MKSPFAKASIYVPIATILLSIPYALATHSDSDWLGLGIIVKVLGGFALGGVFAIFFSVISYIKREPKSGLSLVTAVPAIMFLMILGVQVIEGKRHRKQAIAQTRLFEKFDQQLKNDPGIVFNIDWPTENSSRVFVFNQSFSDPNVPYTREQLQRLWETMPELHGVLLAHPAWDAAFIESQFEDAWERCESGESYTMLASICKNTKTPRYLLEKVAEAKNIPVGAVNPARATLKKLDADKDDKPQ